MALTFENSIFYIHVVLRITYYVLHLTCYILHITSARQSAGLEKALVLFGGPHPCDLSQYVCGDGVESRDVSQPLDDVWVLDVVNARERKSVRARARERERQRAR